MVSKPAGADRALQLITALRETMIDAFAAFDLVGRFIDSNGAFQDLLGYSPDELRQLSYIDITVGKWRQLEESILDSQVRHQGYSDLYKKEVLRKDGQVVIVELRTALLRDETGRPVGLWSVYHDVTSRIQTEKALRDSEAKFRHTFDLLPTGSAIIGLDYRLQHCNRAYCEFLGYTEPELIGKSFLDVTHPDDIAVGMAETKAVAEGRLETAQVVKRYVRKNGDTVWGELTITLVRDAEGNPLHFLPILVDVSARMMAQGALRESDAKLQAVFRSSHDAIGVTKDGVHVLVNPAFVALFGYADDSEILGRTVSEFVAESCRSEALVSFHKRNAGPPAHFAFEVTAVRKDGSEFLVEVSESQFSMNDERFSVSVLRDITERRRAANAIARSEEKFAKAFEMCPESTTIMSMPEGAFVDVNPAFLQITGYTREEVVGKGRNELSIWAVPGDLQRYLKILKADGQVRAFETVFRMKSGELRTGILHSDVIEVDGAPHTLNYIVDVTERRIFEQAGRESQAELERRVAERTAELSVANQELESFSYSISHDLRAPLRTLDGFSRILIEDYESRLDSEGVHLLRRICDAAERMGGLVDDLLQLSRINRSELQSQNVNLSEAALGVIAKLREQEPNRDVTVQISPGMEAVGDPTLLQSLLENLLGNAWKYTGKREHATIEFGQTEVDGCRAFYVRDNGAGFDMAYAGRLFGAFQRLHGESEYPGSGIGLATVQRIVRRHRGEIWAQAEVDKGATFTFTLGPGD